MILLPSHVFRIGRKGRFKADTGWLSVPGSTYCLSIFDEREKVIGREEFRISTR